MVSLSGSYNYVGFSRSTETVSLWPLMSRVKYLSDRRRTLKGPS